MSESMDIIEFCQSLRTEIQEAVGEKSVFVRLVTDDNTQSGTIRLEVVSVDGKIPTFIMERIDFDDGSITASKEFVLSEIKRLKGHNEAAP